MGKYRNPSLTTDIFIFDDDLNFILIKRKNEPYKDYWALPGGFVDYGECVEDAAIREALEERKDAKIIMDKRAIMPKLINFSAIPVAFRPNQTTITQGIVKRMLPKAVETPKNSLRIRPLPFV